MYCIILEVKLALLCLSVGDVEREKGRNLGYIFGQTELQGGGCTCKFSVCLRESVIIDDFTSFPFLVYRFRDRNIPVLVITCL